MAPRLALSLLLQAMPAFAGEAPPGASSCLGCHSPARADGAIPSLRGRDPAEVAALLRAYRDGTAPATVMDRLARGFSEAESRAIAAWVVR
ncbi:cytochrome C [Roseococcus sp. SYP-B2431]|uniref:c-type cytochrome n=1 Tax=Roseococcus sp. SYP-B2431 TaxID=2496640 RepID=UPI001040145D|nr:c-type cytochrome [Roseococcus sp. SYP-B2431]TCH97732.1 cytochrome C [Roseococcus sp. SYP-B2431]